MGIMYTRIFRNHFYLRLSFAWNILVYVISKEVRVYNSKHYTRGQNVPLNEYFHKNLSVCLSTILEFIDYYSFSKNSTEHLFCKRNTLINKYMYLKI